MYSIVLKLLYVYYRSSTFQIPRDMYTRFAKVNHGQQFKKRLAYKEQTHLTNIMHVTLPMENDEYSKLPGQPEWNNEDLLDEEDKP